MNCILPVTLHFIEEFFGDSIATLYLQKMLMN